ncbi:uncharacterized protein DMAD_02170 [Drosophila madeirensis]|uniref:Uncharacterized protein n=1 Tax=Drosophila madeirensis TaxID=30013 RepID=A0AAU9G5F7_DROMD
MESFDNYYNKLYSIIEGVLELPMWPDHELAEALVAMPIDEAQRKLHEAQAIAKLDERESIKLEDLQTFLKNECVASNTRNRLTRIEPQRTVCRLRTRLSRVTYSD